ncbi:MAG: DUF4190 domain-containing protein [Planctomycetota bacterium]
MEPPIGIPSPAPVGRAPTSRLAVASLSLGIASVLTACLPIGILGLVGVTLGMMALERIRASGGALRGRGVAWSGIGTGALGACLALAINWMLVSLQEQWNGQLEAAVKGTFAAVDETGADGAMAKWSPRPGTVLTRGSLTEFALAAKERYGAFTGFTIQSEEREPSLTDVNRITLALALQFEGVRVNGSAVARLSPGRDSVVPILELESLAVRDPERGDLTVPPKADQAAPKAAESPAAEGGDS